MILCRLRRAKPTRPPQASIRPGSPAPTMGPGTGMLIDIWLPTLSPAASTHWTFRWVLSKKVKFGLSPVKVTSSTMLPVAGRANGVNPSGSVEKHAPAEPLLLHPLAVPLFTVPVNVVQVADGVEVADAFIKRSLVSPGTTANA